jgi:hypothetical protein
MGGCDDGGLRTPSSGSIAETGIASSDMTPLDFNAVRRQDQPACDDANTTIAGNQDFTFIENQFRRRTDPLLQ